MKYKTLIESYIIYIFYNFSILLSFTAFAKTSCRRRLMFINIEIGLEIIIFRKIFVSNEK